jgi:predicted DNA-binding transcriptional regulator AlpA
VYGSWKRGEITARKAIEMLGMKTATFYKLVGTVENR